MRTTLGLMLTAAILVPSVFGLAGCGRGIPSEFTVSGYPLEHWLEVLKQGDEPSRLKAVDALGNVGPMHPDAIPALTSALQDRSAAVRSRAALALLKSGPKASSAVPALKTLASSDPDPEVRRCAEAALEHIDGN